VPAGASLPTPAVACILWRQTGDEREVYLARRAIGRTFLGGFWGFPGGAVEPTDTSATSACAREIAEELGVTLPDDTSAYRLVGRFVTPAVSPVRYDCLYFLVAAPPGAEPDPSVSDELERGEWIAPATAAARIRRGEWLAPTPIEMTLAELARGEDDRIEERLAEASRLDRSARLWPFCDGIAIAPLATLTLPPATHTNAYVFGDRELVVVDPGSHDPAEQEALARELEAREAAGAHVLAVLLTHHHGDHTSGAAALAARMRAPIWAHPETARRVPFAIGRELDDGEVVDLGARRLRCVFTPGHAPGHLCFLEEETGWMAAGDMVASVGTILVDPSEGDMRLYLQSLARMAALAPRVLLPAHGAPIADPAGKIAEYVRHRLWREERVATALNARGRAPAHDLVPVAYADVAPVLYPIAERSLLAHLVKLEADGRVRAVGDQWEPVS
jgi:glyoxylase-like metal-dependent hydrolase (beta-lactamase superfamily II)/8-oxo-dGTP pyrophosphatase MutT (NUDIX family)